MGAAAEFLAGAEAERAGRASPAPDSGGASPTPGGVELSAATGCGLSFRGATGVPPVERGPGWGRVGAAGPEAGVEAGCAGRASPAPDCGEPSADGGGEPAGATGCGLSFRGATGVPPVERGRGSGRMGAAGAEGGVGAAAGVWGRAEAGRAG
ncbi:hypothetical protein [Streptomyces sp. NPDC087212]|uniref:hypothetical protein n=1 Tax=Streptomyces sp. NPDC087212 TaxID=3365766 RepID=UPI00381B43C5